MKPARLHEDSRTRLRNTEMLRLIAHLKRRSTVLCHKRLGKNSVYVCSYHHNALALVCRVELLFSSSVRVGISINRLCYKADFYTKSLCFGVKIRPPLKFLDDANTTLSSIFDSTPTPLPCKMHVLSPSTTLSAIEDFLLLF